MQRTPFALPSRWLATLETLAARPILLVCILLAINSLVHPYLGLFHDARLYAAQLTERIAPGSLGQDLYLRYGSQDSYSIFSLLMVPLVRLLGLELCFFIVYLASKALFFIALTRLVLALIADRAAAVASLLFLAMAPLPFGGNEIFHVNESFLTPRLAACAVVLLALERALSGKGSQAGILIAAALTLHPLMGFGGGLVILLWGTSARLSWRWLLLCGLSVVLLGAVVVFYQPLGRRAFGHMDDEWYSVTSGFCFFINPAVWTAGDWVRIGAGAVVAVVAAAYRRELGPLAAALLVAGLMGVVGNLAATHFHYRILIQTSPYRTLWLLEVLAIPLAFELAARLWREPAWGPLAGLGLLVLFTADSNPSLHHAGLVMLVIFPVAVVACRGLRREPTREDWVARSATATLAVGVALMLLFDAYLYTVLLTKQPTHDFDIHPVRVAQSAGNILYKLPLLAVAVYFLARWQVDGHREQRLAGAFALLWLTVQSTVAYLDTSKAYLTRFSVTQRQILQVRAFLDERRAQVGHTPQVYWSADLGNIWFRGQACAYFNVVQLSGCAFNRGTAVEGWRRSRLVRSFEVEDLRRNPMPWPWWQKALDSFYDSAAAPMPSDEALFALSEDQGIDYVIIPDRFDGLYVATAGKYYIYDCTHLRREAKALRQKRGSETAMSPHPRTPPGHCVAEQREE